MNKFKLTEQFIIEIDNGNNLKWYEFVEQADTLLVFEGEAYVDEKNSIIFLSPWKDTYEIENFGDSKLAKWNETKYYATLTETGNMKIFDIQTDNEVDGNKLKELSVSIGCTMKYR